MYKKKCLFRNTKGSWGKEATAIESVWAYLNGVEKKTTGRYRIRITKMSAAEMIAMGVAPENTPAEFFGLQANLDKWHENHAWLPLFDWVGDPDASIDQIEKDLGKQFRSFITGISIEEDFSFDLPKPPREKAIKVPPKKDVKTVDDDKPEDPTKADDDPDFEWL